MELRFWCVLLLLVLKISFGFFFFELSSFSSWHLIPMSMLLNIPFSVSAKIAPQCTGFALGCVEMDCAECFCNRLSAHGECHNIDDDQNLKINYWRSYHCAAIFFPNFCEFKRWACSYCVQVASFILLNNVFWEFHDASPLLIDPIFTLNTGNMIELWRVWAWTWNLQLHARNAGGLY